MNVAIRADGGPDIGYGHIVRTSALAGELIDRGASIQYITATPEPVSAVCSSNVSIREISSRTDADLVVPRLDDVDTLVVDSYLADEQYQRTLRDYCPLAVISDDNHNPICADLLINGNLHATNVEYEFVDTEPRSCLGPEYLLLRSEIHALSREDPPFRSSPERAIITMGGSDKLNRTPTVLEAFDGAGVHVDAIVGPGVPDEREAQIRAASSAIDSPVSIHRNPEQLPRLLFEADFAVSTASTTTYELLALGTPIISHPVVDNQDPIAASLRRRNLATVVARDAGVQEFRAAIDAYVSDSGARKRRQKRGRELVDGNGTERVASELLSLSN